MALLSLTSFFSRIYVNNTKISILDVFKVLILCIFEVAILRLYLSIVRMFSFIGYKKKRNEWGDIKRQKLIN